MLLNITTSFVDKVKLASQSAIANVNKTTKKATEMKKTKERSSQRQPVTQVHEIVSSAMELEPKGKGKGSKSPRLPKVQASPTPAPVTPVSQPKSARKKSKDQVPTPQDVVVAKKQTKSLAPAKVA